MRFAGVPAVLRAAAGAGDPLRHDGLHHRVPARRRQEIAALRTPAHLEYADQHLQGRGKLTLRR